MTSPVPFWVILPDASLVSCSIVPVLLIVRPLPAVTERSMVPLFTSVLIMPPMLNTAVPLPMSLPWFSSLLMVLLLLLTIAVPPSICPVTAFSNKTVVPPLAASADIMALLAAMRPLLTIESVPLEITEVLPFAMIEPPSSTVNVEPLLFR